MDFAPLPLIRTPSPDDDPIEYATYFVGWVQENFNMLSEFITVMDMLHIKELNVAPSRPRAGMIVLADGTNWDPGSGQGFYGYYNSTWNKLG